MIKGSHPHAFTSPELENYCSQQKFCEFYRLDMNLVLEMIDEGLILTRGPTSQQWRFALREIKRARNGHHLICDLQTNIASVTPKMKMLEEVERLQQKNSRKCL